LVGLVFQLPYLKLRSLSNFDRNTLLHTPRNILINLDCVFRFLCIRSVSRFLRNCRLDSWLFKNRVPVCVVRSVKQFCLILCLIFHFWSHIIVLYFLGGLNVLLYLQLFTFRSHGVLCMGEMPQTKDSFVGTFLGQFRIIVELFICEMQYIHFRRLLFNGVKGIIGSCSILHHNFPVLISQFAG
jgi:hypothetical protein